LKKGIGDESITVEVCFESERHLRMLSKKKHRSTCLLEVKSFEGTDASDHNWDQKTAEYLRGIAAVLDRASSGNRPIRIELVQREETNPD